MNNDWQKEFKERYLDKNTPSGLNQRDFQNFTELVRDIPSFIQQLLDNREAEVVKIVNEARPKYFVAPLNDLATISEAIHLTKQAILEQLSNNGGADNE